MYKTLPLPINWNNIQDSLDKTVWDTLTSNFWLPEKIALSNDLKSWGNMTDEEKEVTKKVFAGLTLLDTVQSQVGAVSLMEDSLTPHEEAVYTNIAFMESIHAKSYSSIFSTLCSTEEINELFRWSAEDEFLLKKEEIVMSHYEGDDPHKKKIASTLLESFLFYSGFFWPLYLASHSKLTNTADIIHLILRDESVHGFYIGYKYQKGIKTLPDAVKDEYLDFTISLLLELMENEIKYTESIYDSVGRTEDVKKFLKYNANKALMNLGYDPIYSSDQTQASAAVMSALSPNSGENHDFFSSQGSTYQMIEAEETDDEDWNW